MTKYIAIAPDGTQITRKTNRTYAYAVLCQHPEGSTYAGQWAYGFTSRFDLAQKDADNQRAMGHWANVVIVDAKVAA